MDLNAMGLRASESLSCHERMAIPPMDSQPTGPTEPSKTANQSLLTTLQIMVAVMVPVFGVLNACQSQSIQSQLQQVKQEAERKQQFAGSIQSQLNNLTGASPTKAKVALASLYTLARDESDKLILFTIAIVSQNQELKETAATLVGDDATASQEFKDKVILKLGKIVDPFGNGSPAAKGASKPDLSTEKRLLEQLTQEKKNLSGWIYLGKARQGLSLLGEDKTIANAEIPSNNQQISTLTAVNLRDAAATGRSLGRVQGILSKGTNARVQEIKRTPLSTGSQNDAVWAKVAVID